MKTAALRGGGFFGVQEIFVKHLNGFKNRKNVV